MLESNWSTDRCLAQLVARLDTDKYGGSPVNGYPGMARRFLDHLETRGLTAQTVQPADVDRYLGSLRMAYKRHVRASPSLRRVHRAAIHLLLRTVRGRWPPDRVAATKKEIVQRAVVCGYEAWMKDVRGLAETTRIGRRAEACRFLGWLGEQADLESPSSPTVRQLDDYVQARSATVCRRSLAGVVGRVRALLRYLYFSGATAADLSVVLRGPKLYTAEDIPSALKAQDVQQVLKDSRRERSSLGRRDYAMVTLMATYGLRGGEIVALRLEDLDWRNDVLRVRHSKTNGYSELPLLRAPADALLDYLRHGRPTTTVREVFVRALAPYRALSGSASLYHTIERYLSDAGKQRVGRKGAHAFRHARAVGLLHAAVPLKTIGDVLGHRSPRSTMVYLKLATRDLRAIALDVPGGVSP